jgi:hypothetical protein
MSSTSRPRHELRPHRVRFPGPQRRQGRGDRLSLPGNLPWGATLEVSPAQADIAPGKAAIFHCRLTLDPAIVRPGCHNDQGFLLTAWRIADDADQRWGSCFYFVRPRRRTRLRILRAHWYETHLSVYGTLALDSDVPAPLGDHLPLQVRVCLEYHHAGESFAQRVVAEVEPGGGFSIVRKDFKGPPGVELRVQTWFDRTDLLSSSRSDVFRCKHENAPTIG